MTEPGTQPPAYDSELSLGGIFWTGLGLAVIVVVAVAAMWLVSGFLEERAARLDAPIPRLPAARVQEPPPEPRLQTAPEADLQALRRKEAAILHHYAWEDEAAGVARVPIDRAMELLVERGLSAVTPPADSQTTVDRTPAAPAESPTAAAAAGSGS